MANRPAKRMAIRAMSPRDATMALVANTFSTLIRTEDRLKRQLVAASGLARSVPVRRVSFPRGFEHLPAVVDAIRSDLCTLEA